MNRVKWILLGVCLFGMLIGAAVAYSGYVKKRLDADGAETRAVLTASFARTEYVGYRPGYRGRMHRNFREKRTVYYFRYRFRVGGTDYTGKVRKTENLMTARIGDSVVVRYLPDDPDVHRLVRSEERQIQGDTAPPAQPRPSFGILSSAAVPAVRRPDPFPSPLPCLPFGGMTGLSLAGPAAPAFGAFAACFFSCCRGFNCLKIRIFRRLFKFFIFRIYLFLQFGNFFVPLRTRFRAGNGLQ
ncbi:MAG: DUF3592 domain-containing protein [Alistipes finegoldii]